MSFILKIVIFVLASIAEAKKPNIVIIFADDVGTGDVPGYWRDSSIVDMPNLKNLVAEGTTFTDAHSTPICAPSRYMLLSGNYQHRGVRHTGIWNANYKTSNFWEGQQSIAEVLRNNGYNCGVFGKWHLGAKVPTKNGFEFPIRDWAVKEQRKMLSNENHDWRRPLTEGPSRLGFDTSYVAMQGIQRSPFIFFRDEYLDVPNLNNVTEDIKFWVNGEYKMEQGISMIQGGGGQGAKDWDSTAFNMIVVNETEKFIDDHLGNSNTADQPFFAYLPLGAAHKPHSPPYKYIDGTPIAGVYPNRHLDILNELDMVVGSVTSILEERNLLNDTILVFLSDNGGITTAQSDEHGHFSSGPLRNGKGSIFEGGHRVPLTIRWDNGDIPKGERRKNLLGLNDMFATLCDLAGISVPEKQAIDSISFANHIFNQSNTENLRNSLGFWVYSNKLAQSSIRKGHMKLIHHYQTGKMELYNLNKDLKESKNILKGNKRVASRMMRELRKIGACYDSFTKFKVGETFRKCGWFMADKSRCYRHLEGIYHCRKTCATLKDRNECNK